MMPVMSGHEQSVWQALLERDGSFSYRTHQLPALPLLNSQQEIIGVLEFTNPRDNEGKICEFSAHMQKMLQALSQLAGATLQGYFGQKNERTKVSVNYDNREKQVE
ncbi:MAG: GAF domain-containing protein [Anaerolineae bacterium]|nr:GAF domain-containing protein [Anaerolineae bacterium]